MNQNGAHELPTTIAHPISDVPGSLTMVHSYAMGVFCRSAAEIIDCNTPSVGLMSSFTNMYNHSGASPEVLPHP